VLDQYLDAVAVLSPVAIALMSVLVGIKLARNPQDQSHKRWWLAIMCLGVICSGATLWQQKRARKAHSDEVGHLNDSIKDLRQDVRTAETARAVDAAESKARLDTISQFVAHPPPSLDIKQLAATVNAMARPSLRGWPADLTDAHSAALLNFFSTNFPEMLELNELDRFFLYYLMKHGGSMSSSLEEWAKLRKLYAQEFKMSDDAANAIAGKEFNKLRGLNFIQIGGVQVPTLSEPYYSRLQRLLDQGHQVP
jgi:hypothetical protein